MTLEIRISTGSSIPVYRQIADQVRKAVATGTLQVGEQLPSVRALAEFLVINPNTVARAYSELTREGIIEGQAGKGLFVAPRRQIFSTNERQRRLHNALDTFLNEVMLLDFSPAEIVQLLEQRLAELNGDSATATLTQTTAIAGTASPQTIPATTTRAGAVKSLVQKTIRRKTVPAK